MLGNGQGGLRMMMTLVSSVYVIVNCQSRGQGPLSEVRDDPLARRFCVETLDRQVASLERELAAVTPLDLEDKDACLIAMERFQSLSRPDKGQLMARLKVLKEEFRRALQESENRAAGESPAASCRPSESSLEREWLLSLGRAACGS